MIITAIAIIILFNTVSAAETTERVSVGPGLAEGNGDSNDPSISADGRYVAFASEANNLVANDNNGVSDIFMHDKNTDTTILVSKGLSGGSANGASVQPSISADGRYIAFSSSATDLVIEDTLPIPDIFVYDRISDTMQLISRGIGGQYTNSASIEPSISADGAYVAYTSGADNIVPDDTNGASDVFIFNRNTLITELVSRGPGGTPPSGSFGSFSPSVSANGRYVAFASWAENLVTDDTNGWYDIFVYDRTANSMERVSIGPGGVEANYLSAHPSISGNGRYIAFDSGATNLVSGDINNQTDIFVHDRTTHTTTLISMGLGGVQANGMNVFPSISSDGRYVAFSSMATNLVSGDTNNVTDVFLYDSQGSYDVIRFNLGIFGTINRISLANTGAQADGSNSFPTVSSNGRYVAFTSSATNLLGAGGDNNGAEDVYVRDRGQPQGSNETIRTSPGDSDNLSADDEPINPNNTPTGNLPAEAIAASITTKETGVPIWGLILAILMVTNGLILPMKK